MRCVRMTFQFAMTFAMALITVIAWVHHPISPTHKVKTVNAAVVVVVRAVKTTAKGTRAAAVVDLRPVCFKMMVSVQARSVRPEGHSVQPLTPSREMQAPQPANLPREVHMRKTELTAKGQPKVAQCLVPALGHTLTDPATVLLATAVIVAASPSAAAAVAAPIVAAVRAVPRASAIACSCLVTASPMFVRTAATASVSVVRIAAMFFRVATPNASRRRVALVIYWVTVWLPFLEVIK